MDECGKSPTLGNPNVQWVEVDSERGNPATQVARCDSFLEVCDGAPHGARMGERIFGGDDLSKGSKDKDAGPEYWERFFVHRSGDTHTHKGHVAREREALLEAIAQVGLGNSSVTDEDFRGDKGFTVGCMALCGLMESATESANHIATTDLKEAMVTLAMEHRNCVVQSQTKEPEDEARIAAVERTAQAVVDVADILLDMADAVLLHTDAAVVNVHNSGISFDTSRESTWLDDGVMAGHVVDYYDSIAGGCVRVATLGNIQLVRMKGQIRERAESFAKKYTGRTSFLQKTLIEDTRNAFNDTQNADDLLGALLGTIDALSCAATTVWSLATTVSQRNGENDDSVKTTTSRMMASVIAPVKGRVPPPGWASTPSILPEDESLDTREAAEMTSAVAVLVSGFLAAIVDPVQRSGASDVSVPQAIADTLSWKCNNSREGESGQSTTTQEEYVPVTMNAPYVSMDTYLDLLEGNSIPRAYGASVVARVVELLVAHPTAWSAAGFSLASSHRYRIASLENVAALVVAGPPSACRLSSGIHAFEEDYKRCTQTRTSRCLDAPVALEAIRKGLPHPFFHHMRIGEKASPFQAAFTKALSPKDEAFKRIAFSAGTAHLGAVSAIILNPTRPEGMYRAGYAYNPCTPSHAPAYVRPIADLYAAYVKTCVQVDRPDTPAGADLLPPVLLPPSPVFDWRAFTTTLTGICAAPSRSLAVSLRNLVDVIFPSHSNTLTGALRVDASSMDPLLDGLKGPFYTGRVVVPSPISSASTDSFFVNPKVSVSFVQLAEELKQNSPMSNIAADATKPVNQKEAGDSVTSTSVSTRQQSPPRKVAYDTQSVEDYMRSLAEGENVTETGDEEDWLLDAIHQEHGPAPPQTESKVHVQSKSTIIRDSESLLRECEPILRDTRAQRALVSSLSQETLTATQQHVSPNEFQSSLMRVAHGLQANMLLPVSMCIDSIESVKQILSFMTDSDTDIGDGYGQSVSEKGLLDTLSHSANQLISGMSSEDRGLAFFYTPTGSSTTSSMLDVLQQAVDNPSKGLRQEEMIRVITSCLEKFAFGSLGHSASKERVFSRNTSTITNVGGIAVRLPGTHKVLIHRPLQDDVEEYRLPCSAEQERIDAALVAPLLFHKKLTAYLHRDNIAVYPFTSHCLDPEETTGVAKTLTEGMSSFVIRDIAIHLARHLGESGSDNELSGVLFSLGTCGLFTFFMHAIVDAFNAVRYSHGSMDMHELLVTTYGQHLTNLIDKRMMDEDVRWELPRLIARDLLLLSRLKALETTRGPLGVTNKGGRACVYLQPVKRTEFEDSAAIDGTLLVESRGDARTCSNTLNSNGVPFVTDTPFKRISVQYGKQLSVSVQSNQDSDSVVQRMHTLWNVIVSTPDNSQGINTLVRELSRITPSPGSPLERLATWASGISTIRTTDTNSTATWTDTSPWEVLASKSTSLYTAPIWSLGEDYGPLQCSFSATSPDDFTHLQHVLLWAAIAIHKNDQTVQPSIARLVEMYLKDIRYVRLVNSPIVTEASFIAPRSNGVIDVKKFDPVRVMGTDDELSEPMVVAFLPSTQKTHRDYLCGMGAQPTNDTQDVAVSAEKTDTSTTTTTIVVIPTKTHTRTMDLINLLAPRSPLIANHIFTYNA